MDCSTLCGTESPAKHTKRKGNAADIGELYTQKTAEQRGVFWKEFLKMPS